MKVSVCMITYNHEKFVAQAIESVLMQETDFDYELVIGEDCSTDGTAAIVADYQQRYPEKIRANIRDKNVGMMANFFSVLEACTGEYMAMCEGDDYWISPHKLQTQVDYLGAHPEVAVSFQRASIVYEGAVTDKGTHWPGYDVPALTSLEHYLVSDNYIPECTAVVRNIPIRTFPEWFFRAEIDDLALWLMHARYGLIHYDSSVGAIYRKHSGGVTEGWQSQGACERKLRMYQGLRSVLGREYQPYINQGIDRLHYALALLAERRNDMKAARRQALRRLAASAFRRRRGCDKTMESAGRHLARLMLPGLHRTLRLMRRSVLGDKPTGDT
jgi:hypothetical protein